MCLITPTVNGVPEETQLVDRVRAAAKAGVHLIQIRQRDMEGGALARLVVQAVAAVRGTGARVLVNDRVDVALATGAHGVHLREDSVEASRVRAVVPPGFVLSRSVHSPEAASRAAADGGLDFLVFGTVFETRSKPGAATAGTARLAAACEAVPLPVLAVGGIAACRLGDVAGAGATGFAAIGLFADVSIERLPDAVDEASRAFDTADRRL
jgi:thiamine-phosphate pyrophosphorylase